MRRLRHDEVRGAEANLYTRGKARMASFRNSAAFPPLKIEENEYMKLGIEGDSPDPISQYYSINTDNS